MLNPVSNSAIPSYLLAQKSPTLSLLSLPIEIQEEIENWLDFSDQKTLFEAQTTVTHNGDSVDSPALKLHLMQKRVPPKYQQTLISSDASLQAFALNQLKILWKSGQLDQVVERLALFKLLLLLAGDSAIFGFLTDRIQQEPELKRKLLNWVERSKTEEVQPVAANALTLLVKAGVQLNGLDFSQIKVRGADLSYGVFDYTQFEGADLREVNWHRSWLRGVNLDGADLAGVEFDEKSTLETKTGIAKSLYSPDGQWLASLGRNAGIVKLWGVGGTRALAHTYIGHEGPVECLAFSPDGQWLASASWDKAVKLWSVRTGDCQAALSNFAGHVYAVAWQTSPDGATMLVTGGQDKAVSLWRVAHDSGQIGKIRLDWTSWPQGVLNAADALIENVRNLSPQNAALLRQRGAVQAHLSESHS